MGLRHTRAIALVGLSVALAFGSGASPAAASTVSGRRRQAEAISAQVSTLDRELQTATARYDSARTRLSRASAASTAGARTLDDLLARLSDLQTRLDARATDMYRSGPLGFVDVLAGSTTFEQFASTWEMLAQISSDDAYMIAQLKSTRSRATAQADILMRNQQKAAGTLSRLAATRATIQAELSQRRSLLAGAQQAARSLESAQARAAARIVVARTAVPASAHRQPANPYSGVTGSGSWSAATASCYGDGSVGSHTADGETIALDSMIVAHKTLPFGTLVEFEYHGQTGVAKVADRGPFVPGREFDLGPGIAHVLGFNGVDTVRYRIIGR